MKSLSVEQLIPILQTAIGPVILISGVGLLLLTMTNRLGRTIDRLRLLASGLPNAGEEIGAAIEGQLRILLRRARLIRLSIVLVSASALSAAILIILLFFTALLGLESAWLISALFVFCMGCLIGALGVFIHDLNQSLTALKMELKAEGFHDI